MDFSLSVQELESENEDDKQAGKDELTETDYLEHTRWRGKTGHFPPVSNYIYDFCVTKQKRLVSLSLSHRSNWNATTATYKTLHLLVSKQTCGS